MSLIKNFVYLPTYILDYVVDEPTPKIDADRFLSTATPTELRQMIVAFYPHFEFTVEAQNATDLLRMIFREMVSTRLSNLVVPSPNDTKYFQVPSFLRGPVSSKQRAPVVVDSLDDIYKDCMAASNTSALAPLKKGLYHLPAATFQSFLDTYKVPDEMEGICSAQTDAEEALHDDTPDPTNFQETIEGIQLQSRHSSVSLTEQKDLTEAAQDVGSISACTDLHSTSTVYSTPDPTNFQEPIEGIQLQSCQSSVSLTEQQEVPDEMEGICSSQIDAEEALHDDTPDPTNFQETIEGIQLQSRHSLVSLNEQKDLTEGAQDVGSISVCTDLHSTSTASGPSPNQHCCPICSLNSLFD
ncbi:uncharacterized protein MELLADRAFT_90807 [Melampsora larici-populina 98AG31]|uniref:Uncharacterized protein n=1 Tax=Melampsora larici-populina (strain 98AG31 / pathotype 3-4-7) TaxID=747676 RepID=F4R7K1_MELLP|nr:uncharacterized protein MELLADRAFT_90807 [Melampsora larici-populina 98AG31]EGG11770.1 hypothetical protein MELLADRAFT_90807 [Melampsora larici-populina 98AG31]